ncbi:MAG TPA: urease accessory protein UreF [Polyangia bacterium]|nr:urease accessory protein UreF [Polyangia bacterium]
MSTEGPDATPLQGGSLALVRLLQIVSPALPIGAFAYSQGLEQAVADGWVTDEAEATAWLLGLLEWSFGTLDLPVLARLLAAWRAGDAAAVARWSAWLSACRPTREMRAEDRQLGAALARVLETLGIVEARAWATHLHVTHPTMFALGATRFEVPLGAALAGYAFSWAEALTGAAVRLVPLGQNAGQRMLATAGKAIPSVVERALELPDDELGSAALGQAIASARHETLYSRLFRS